MHDLYTYYSCNSICLQECLDIHFYTAFILAYSVHIECMGIHFCDTGHLEFVYIILVELDLP